MRFGPFRLTSGAGLNQPCQASWNIPSSGLSSHLLNLYFWVILITVIMSWLIGFNVINGANPYVRQISYALHRLTEPLLGPIRRLPARSRRH